MEKKIKKVYPPGREKDSRMGLGSEEKRGYIR